MMNIRQADLKKDPAAFIRLAIESFVSTAPENRMQLFNGDPIFEAPVVGYASGADPLFTEYKQIIGEFHLTPQEVVELATGKRLPPDKLTVIGWVLPVALETRVANRKQNDEPALRWSHARRDSDVFMEALRKHLVGLLQELGYLAIVSVKSPGFKTFEFNGLRTSNWSERHALYAAGLGTFGLADTMITPKGMAMRCGTLTTDLLIPPTPRTATNHMGNCLFYNGGSCRRCIERCPAGAITEKGHDKALCRHFMQQVLKPIFKEKYGWEHDTGCALCQTAVPCESATPLKKKQAVGI